MSKELEISELNAFSEFCNTRFGIVLQQYQKDSLKKHVESTIKKYGFSSYYDYLTALKISTISDIISIEFVKAITVEESYFFRGKNQFSFIENQVLAKLISKRRQSGTKYLRIWSAGCAAGQELYSILKLLLKLLDDPKDWSLYLLGTDINIDSIERGK